MKKHSTLAMIVFALLGAGALSHASEHDGSKAEPEKISTETVRQKLNEAAEAIKNYSADKKDEAAIKAKAALDELDQRINILEKQIDRDWDKMDKAARVQARNNLKTLREKRLQAAEWYGALKNSSAEAWEQMKQGFLNAYKSLRSDWEKFEKEQGKNGKSK